MKYRFLWLCFILFVNPISAQDVPGFNPQSLTLSIPAFLPGIMDDTTALLHNDTLSYVLRGQIFNLPYKIVTTKRKRIGNSPWTVLLELADAYGRKDKKKIIDLYDEGSRDKITQLLSGSESGTFLQYASDAVHSNLKIVGGIEYQSGFMVYSKDDKYGLHVNFMLKGVDGYKLAVLDDQSPTGWNLGLYFKNNPGQLIPVKNVLLPDSISIENTMTVVIILPEASRWVAIYFGKAGEPIKALVEDNGPNDLDKQKKVVRFRVPASIFPTPGTYNFYISSFNYPVQRISANFFLPDARHVIKVF